MSLLNSQLYSKASLVLIAGECKLGPFKLQKSREAMCPPRAFEVVQEDMRGYIFATSLYLTSQGELAGRCKKCAHSLHPLGHSLS